MNEKSCAPTCKVEDWASIDWNKACAYVKKAANAYRKGSTRRSLQQSENAAMAVNSLRFTPKPWR